MAHTAEEVVAASQTSFPAAVAASMVYPDDPEPDKQWWVTDANYNTIAYAWYDVDDVFHVRDYHP